MTRALRYHHIPRILAERQVVLLLGGVVNPEIEYLEHFCAHSPIITNTTYYVTTRAVLGSRQAGSPSQAYKRRMIYGNS